MPVQLNHRELIIAGYKELIATKCKEAWQPYFLNFMFKQLPANRATKFAVMQNEVARVYSTLITHVLRRPRSKTQARYAPILVGCPDNQVLKNDQQLDRANINDGWHFNAVILLPPDDACRFREHLANHFETNRGMYCGSNDRLQRIHVSLINNGTMVDYTLKQFARGNIENDDIVLFPRALNELGKRNQFEHELKRVGKTYLTGSRIHPGYELVEHLDKIWRALTADFDPYSAAASDMSTDEIKKLIGGMKKMRKVMGRATDEFVQLVEGSKK